MGDDQAFIFTDVGIKDQLPGQVPTNLFKVRLDYKAPREDGMPTAQEFEPAKAVEDALEDFVSNRGDHYVGRITVGGQRHFFFYVQDFEGYEDRVAEIGKEHSYELLSASSEDAGHSEYWNNLCPTDADWQIIRDMRVIEALGKEGDDPSLERDVDHYVYFADLDKAKQYRDWALEAGLAELRPIELVEEQHSVKLRHRGTMHLGDISGLSVALVLKAKELDGDYDGWETVVMKPGEQDGAAGA